MLIKFGEELFPDDLYIQDQRPEANSYHGCTGPMHTMLERLEPGKFSELDIVMALKRVFKSDQIYLTPCRPDNGKEFVDVMVATPKSLLLIQAKDSPNTGTTLGRSMARKKAVTLSHIRKAAKQLQGSISYMRSCASLQVRCDGQLHEFVVGSREVFGLIVVKELFIDEYSAYSPIALELFKNTGIPCFIQDHQEFDGFTFYNRTEGKFSDTLKYVYKVAQERNELPRLRCWP